MIEYEFIGFPLFYIHIDLEFVLIHKAKKKKTLVNIQPYILTSHMVDNAYLFSCKMLFGDGIISYWKRCCGMSPGQTINQALSKTGYFTQTGIKTSQKTCSLKN